MPDRIDSKHAEKQYLERSGGSAWEREKPFSPAAADTLEESLDLLHDFAVALQVLTPLPTDRVIDLGAGGGWCSDLLQRLNRKAVAVDISLDMLRVSRQRQTRAPIVAVAGDFEALPFVDGAFDKAVCLNALHHVPDMAAAVREIARVLGPNGVAVFSEPGKGHADRPGSIAATRDFGVLEQEVRIEPFMDACQAAGFADVRICPISYAIPEFQLSLREWNAWTRLARSKRPVRALQKLWRAVLEFCGIGKQSVLFEEAFAIRLVRLFQEPVLVHPFVVAAKQRHSASREPAYLARIRVESMPTDVPPGESVTAIVAVTNHGRAVWPQEGASIGDVRLGAQLLDSRGRLVNRDLARVGLPGAVKPGETAVVRFEFSAPPPGEHQIKFDMVAEGVTWFEPTGSPTEIRMLRVR